MKLKIDGLDVEVPSGTTVKEAARHAGIIIPGLCDHPGFKPYGGCRLCLVEIDGIRGFPSSCTMPASEGMVVRTNTPAISDLRKSVLEMLLSEHPSNCLFCERAGRCNEAREPMRKVPEAMGCRFCPKDQRCALQETVEQIGLEKVDLFHIGSPKKVVRSPFFDRDPNLCILCGRCVRACEARDASVISFVFRGFEAGIGTAFDKPLEEMGCRFCGACVDVCPTGALAERAGRWAGPAENVVATTCPYCSANCQIGLETGVGRLLRVASIGSNLCVRGRFGTGFVQDQTRLKLPLVRKDGKLIETSWDEALDVAARGLSRFSGGQFAAMASGVCTNEALYLFSKFAGSAMNTRAVAPDAAVAGIKAEEIPDWSKILVVGDLAKTCPAVELALRSAKGLAVIGPFESNLSKAARAWLRPNPGCESQIISSLVAALKGEDLNLGGCGINEEEIRDLASSIEGASIIAGPDCSADVVRAANDLARAARGRLYVLGANCNSQGVSDLRMDIGFQETIRALKEGKTRAAYIMGFNPAKSMPELAESLSRLDFLVVQDIFPTETAKLANVVLPAASFAEVDGTFSGPEGVPKGLTKAVEPIGRSLPDWQITAGLARRIGTEGFDFGSVESVQEEMRSHLAANRARSQIPREGGFFGNVENEPQVIAPVNPTAKGSQLVLVFVPSLYSFGSGTRTSKIPDLRYLAREETAEINPKDAKAIGVSNGDGIVVDTGGGSIKAASRLSGKVPRGVLRMEFKPGLNNITDCKICRAAVRRDV